MSCYRSDSLTLSRGDSRILQPFCHPDPAVFTSDEFGGLESSDGMPCRALCQTNVSGKPSKADMTPVFIGVFVTCQQNQVEVDKPTVWVFVESGPVPQVQDCRVPHTSLWFKFVFRARHAGVPSLFMMNKTASPAFLFVGTPPEAAAARMRWRVVRQFVVAISHLEWL